MRILHLLESSPHRGLADGALAAIAILQRQDLENEHLVVCFAPIPEARRAQQFGVKVSARSATPAQRTRSASIVLKRMIREIGHFDRVQPWSPRAADLLQSFSKPAPLAKSLPAMTPLNPDHCSIEARERWKRQLRIRDDELVITLLDLDPSASSAGAFGLAIAPVTCALQDRTIVGLIPETHDSDGATRARRYAGTAGEVWRIELVSAPLYASAICADVILCPTASTEPLPWRCYSSVHYAITCALARSIPIVAGSFEQRAEPILAPMPGIVPAESGRVKLVTALNDVCINPGIAGDASESVLRDHAPDRWLSKWRQKQGVAVLS
jgi:hypothetical protein